MAKKEKDVMTKEDIKNYESSYKTTSSSNTPKDYREKDPRVSNDTPTVKNTGPTGLNNPFTNSQATTYYKRDGTPISVRNGANVTLDSNGYFIGTGTQSGGISYAAGENPKENRLKPTPSVFDNLRNAITNPTTTPQTTTSPQATTTPIKTVTPISTTTTPTTTYTQPTNNITQLFDTQNQNLIQQLRQKIQQGMQQFQPMRNQVEVGRNSNLASFREALANQGDRGGTGRQELLGINTAADNNLNSINQQEQNYQAQGESDIQNAVNTSDMEKLRALITEDQRQQDMAREDAKYNNDLAYRDKVFQYQQNTDARNFDYQKYIDSRNFKYQNDRNAIEDAYRDGQISLEQKRYELSKTEQEYEQDRQDALDKISKTRYEDETKYQREQDQLEQEIASIGAYSGDYQAEINRRSAVNPNDPLIPFLQAARNEKIAQQKAAADNSVSQAYKNAYNLWLQLGVATPEIASILGIPSGSKTLDKIKADYTTAKPYYAPKSSSSNSGSSNNYGLNW